MGRSTWNLRLILAILSCMFINGDSYPSVGFSVALRRVDADNNLTKIELMQRAARRSHQRLARLSAKLFKSNTTSSITGEYTAPVHAGNGEFFMELAIGTPKVAFSAIVDTGSDLIWTQCQPCLSCFEQPTPVFDPAKSSSYSGLPCTNRLCLALPTAACSRPSGDCNYLYSYGDSSTTQGMLATETFSIGTSESAAVQRIAFGCGNDNQGEGFSQGGGLVGLGRGALSLISQLNLTRFSYCLTSLDESKTSPLLLGELAKLNASTTAKLVRSREQPSFYYLSLIGISVGGDRLVFPKEAFELQSDGSGGLIIDSGTSITYLEEEIYRTVKKAFLERMKLPAVDGGEAGVGLDVCFKTAKGTEEVQVPKMVLHFEGGNGGGGGGDLEMPAENYMVLDSLTGLLCLTMMGSRGISILGNFQQQNIHILYDLKKEMVSFEPTECHQL